MTRDEMIKWVAGKIDDDAVDPDTIEALFYAEFPNAAPGTLGTILDEAFETTNLASEQRREVATLLYETELTHEEAKAKFLEKYPDCESRFEQLVDDLI